ncbi:uncharacterized protein GO595_008331 [Histomonas meleagridis]|uniref:uncharacterized protein n=1 Tax=Histomonas meleagridis TaxID=135588 RepID=UPI00355AA5D9|nr:hypothetical protein GO595_008331 [Histomonas meleagridis]
MNQMIKSIKYKINPIIETILNELANSNEENVRLTCKAENATNQSLLYLKAFSEISSYISKLQSNYSQLWSISVSLAKLLISSDKDYQILKSKLNDYSGHIKLLINRIHKLECELLTANKREEWILQEIQELFTSPNLLINAQNSFNLLCASISKENEAKLSEYESQIASLNQKYKDSTEASIKLQAECDEKIRILEEENSALKEKNLLSDKSNEKFKNELQELHTSLEILHEKADRAEILDTAIDKFCSKCPYIYFDGVNLQYKVGTTLTQENALESALESIRKENKELQQEIQKLKTNTQKISAHYQSDIDELRSNTSKEIHSLRKALETSQTSCENALAETQQLNFEIKQLNYEKQRVEKQLKSFQEQNQELKLKSQEIKQNQKKIISNYQKNLPTLTSISSESVLFPQINIPSLDNADIIYKEANETLTKDNEQLKKEIKKLKKEIIELKSNKEEKTEKIGNVINENKIEELENELKVSQDKINELQQKIVGIETDKEKSQTEINDLNEKNNKLKKAYQRYKKDVNLQIDSYKNEILQLKLQIEDLA